MADPEMKNRKRYIFPALYLLSLVALMMKKFMFPFHGFFVIVIFDAMAVVYFLRAFTFEKLREVPNAKSFNFDIGSIVYAVCSIAILHRLQYWEGWERWIFVSGILFLIVSILTVLSFRIFFRLSDSPNKFRTFFSGHLSWFYFLILFPLVAFTNPRTFHNLFNGTTFEEYVRMHYSMGEATAMLEKYKPEDARSKKCAEEFLTKALASKSNQNYQEALEYFNKSIDKDPDNAVAIYQRGLLKLTKLEIDREMAQSAHDDFSRALQLDSTMAGAYYHRAVAQNYLNKKDRREAHNDFLKAKLLDTNLYHDKNLNDFLALPLTDTTVDTTSYVKMDGDD
jgi:tetratricopeptide (TPR) repeat protein